MSKISKPVNCLNNDQYEENLVYEYLNATNSDDLEIQLPEVEKYEQIKKSKKRKKKSKRLIENQEEI